LQPRTIAVEGHGVVRAAPDTFVLSVGVQRRNKNLDEACAGVSEVCRRITEAAGSFPIDAKRTRTTRFEIDPQYDRDTLELSNYEASEHMEIYLTDVSQSRELTAAVLRAGATSVSIDFIVARNQNELVERARQAALRDARQKAETMASVYGDRVGAALQIGRPGYTGGMWGYEVDWEEPPVAVNADDQSVTWIAPTEIEVDATVFVRFALTTPAKR